MPKKENPTKSNKKSDKEKISELEKKLAKMEEENQKMELVLAKKEKLLDKYKKLKAEESLANIIDEVEEEEPEEVEFEPEPILQPEPKKDEEVKSSKFEELLRRFNQNDEGSVEVYRVKNGIEAKIGRYPVKEFGTDLDEFAKRFGGGEYRLILRDNKGQIRAKLTEYYDELAYPIPTQPPQLPIYSIPQQPQQDLTGLIKAIQENSEKQTNMMMSMMMKFIDGLNQRNQFINSIKDIVQIKELLSEKKEDNPLKSLDTLLTTLQKGIELGQITSSGESSSEFVELIKLFAPMVMNLRGGKPLNLSNSNSNPLNEVIQEVKEKVEQSKQIERVGYLENPNEIKQIEGEKSMDITKLELNGIGKVMFESLYKPAIIELAKKEHNAEEVSDLIISKLPEDYYMMAFDICSAPNRYDLVIKFIPEIADKKEWIEKVLDYCKKTLLNIFAEIDKENKKEKDNKEKKKK